MTKDALRELSESWEASAQRIGERGLRGDPAANIATMNALRSCALALRAAVSSESDAGLDVERLARAICATRPPSVEATSDLFVDDECRAWARRAAAEYLDLAE